MTKRILFFDLETTGLPIVRGFANYYPYSHTKYYDKSRIVQFAALIYSNKQTADPNGEQKGEQKDHGYQLEHTINFIIQPDGFEIKNSNIHGITQHIAEQTGVPFLRMIDEIAGQLSECTLLVAHNIIFDKHVFLSELYRYGKHDLANILNSIPTFCTANETASILRLPAKRRKYKMPKLSELYRYLFQHDAENLHDAVNDVCAMSKCFFYLLDKGLIKIA
jgi:DNA polymerase III epsilon subunit-like protein